MSYREIRILTGAKGCLQFFPCVQHTAYGKDFKLILTVKMQTRGPFVTEFPAICITAELWGPEVTRTGNFKSNFCVFWKNYPYWQNFQNSVLKIYVATSIDVVVYKCRKIVRQEISEIVSYLHDKKQQNFGSLSNCHYCADRAQNPPGPAPIFGSQCSKFHPNRFTFGGVIAERVKTVLLAYRVFAIFAFGQIITMITTLNVVVQHYSTSQNYTFSSRRSMTWLILTCSFSSCNARY